MARVLAVMLAAGVAFPALAVQHRDRIPVRPVDFELPLGIAEKIPADVPLSEVFVSDDFCFYFRKDGQFTLIGCVG